MKWFVYFIEKSVLQRKLRIAVACLAVMVGVGISCALITLSLGIREKLGEELKAYGANMMIVGKGGGYLDENATGILKRIAERIEKPMPQLYGQAILKNRTVEITGIDLDSTSGMRVNGSIPAEGEVMAGTVLRDASRLSLGSEIELITETGRKIFKISGFFERGGAEDRGIIMRLKDAQKILGLENRVSAILLRGKGDLNTLVSEIEALIPDSEIKTLRQIAQAEISLLGKVEFLMALVSIVVLFGASLSVGSTMNTTILERRKEIGLMKALGGSRKRIRMLLLSEALIIGGLGGILGFPLGFASAQLVSKGAFGAFVAMPWHLPFLSLSLGLLLGLMSSLIPLKGAIRLEPAVILRGE